MSVMITSPSVLSKSHCVHLHDGLHVLEASDALFFRRQQSGRFHDHFVVFFDSDFFFLASSICSTSGLRAETSGEPYIGPHT